MKEPKTPTTQIRSRGRRSGGTENEEPPYPIASMFSRIRAAIHVYPKAMLFELRDKGFDSVFEQLIACLLSIRTFDEVSGPAALALFKQARTPRELARLSEANITELISKTTYPGQKARTLKRIAEIILAEHQGKTPESYDELVALPGVGPKCAGLTAGIALGEPRIGVDVHVHRVTNRWGYVHAPTPEKTLLQLEAKLPRSRWVEINELLVPFGKHICTGQLPRCSVCPVARECRRVGVTRHR